jgi:hypothetical protein
MALNLLQTPQNKFIANEEKERRKFDIALGQNISLRKEKIRKLRIEMSRQLYNNRSIHKLCTI